MKNYLSLLFIWSAIALHSQSDQDFQSIINSVSASRLQKDITTLANFGTRHTLSDTLSDQRGIGAARRWIKKEFEMISKGCDNCLEVFYQKKL